jgi:hypothetical protein
VRPEIVKNGGKADAGFRELLLNHRRGGVFIIIGEFFVQVEHAHGDVIIIGAGTDLAGRFDGHFVWQETVDCAFRDFVSFPGPGFRVQVARLP